MLSQNLLPFRGYLLYFHDAFRSAGSWRRSPIRMELERPVPLRGYKRVAHNVASCSRDFLATRVLPRIGAPRAPVNLTGELPQNQINPRQLAKMPTKSTPDDVPAQREVHFNLSGRWSSSTPPRRVESDWPFCGWLSGRSFLMCRQPICGENERTE
jgi:hypothetical protein